MGKILIRKGLIVAIIFLFVTSGIIPFSAHEIIEKLSQPYSKANILYVGGNGPGNYTKIQDAIDDSQPGDTIYVYDDSSPYYENIFISKSINLIGEDLKNTVINGMGIDDPIWVNTSFVNIRSFTVVNSSITGSSQGICLVDKKWHYPGDPYITLTNINISDCIIKNNDVGIRLDNTMNVNVLNCTIESNVAHSIYNIYSRHVKIYQCNISGNGEDLGNESGHPGGIVITNNPDLGNSEDIKIYNCNIKDNILFGVAVDSGSSKIIINNNTINQNTFAGIFVSSSSGNLVKDIFIEDNFLLSNGQGYWSNAGITIQDCINGILIRNNNISYNNHSGIFASHSSGITLVNNFISKNHHYGLYLTSSSIGRINNNFIINNRGRYFVGLSNLLFRNTMTNHEGIDIFQQDGNSQKNVIYHNNFINNTQNAMDYGNNTWDDDYPSGGNYWDDYTGMDNYYGVDQNESGPDGIGDTLYNFSDGTNQDHYPLMLPYGMTNLTIKFVPKPFKSLISIKNVGSTTALNVHWLLTLNGGFLFCKREYSGIVKPLLPGEEITLTPRFFLIGLGHIEVQISSWADNAPVVSTKITGHLLLFFFFIR